MLRVLLCAFLLVAVQAGYNYPFTTHYFVQSIDHFNFVTGKTTYRQRWLLNDDHWAGNGSNAPILFYTGNEGPIDTFLNNTGLMFDWAPKMKALVVFAEHRYYGDSLPFGWPHSFDSDKIGFLSSTQALADFVDLIRHIKDIFNCPDSPVISFGGSYGGMLTAWLRAKYPNIVAGGIAASAPVQQYLVSDFIYDQILATDFTNAGCGPQIVSGFNQLAALGKTTSGRQQLSKIFRTCTPVTTNDQVYSIYNAIYNELYSIAMVDYPYPTNFIGPYLPAWPVKAACQRANKSSDALSGLKAMLDMFYNDTGSTSCFDFTDFLPSANVIPIPVGAGGDTSPVAKAWNFQVCTELYMPLSSDGAFFLPNKFDYDAQAAFCQAQYGIQTSKTWQADYYGDVLKHTSNTFFSNGLIDPWHSGGILESYGTNVAHMIQDGAHHVDLRGSNPADTVSIRAARDLEYQYAQQWINQHYAERGVKPNYM